MTPFTLTTLTDLQSLTVDTIIDVRASAEYEEDHLPDAINLPVLNNAQRAEVGTIYTQDSPFKARKIGGALVAQNTARHLQGPLAEKDGGWQPLVYCWRGGQRSGAFATILDQVGWRVQLLNGGYQSYRRAVVKMLYENQLPHRIMLIEGGTGTAKTALLHRLAEQGAQIIDLEGLADHRGSLFGAISTAQPSQKMFETRVARELITLDPDKITFVEAESSKVGNRIIPPSLWTLMMAAPHIHITAPLRARSQFLCRAYADLTQDKAALGNQLDKLRPYHSRERLAQWHAQVQTNDWRSLAAGLIADHYDPRYARSKMLRGDAVYAFEVSDLEDQTLTQTAESLLARFN